MSFFRPRNRSFTPTSSQRSGLYLAFAASLQIMIASRGYSAPELDRVVSGGWVDGPSGGRIDVHQDDKYMVIDWKSFDLNKGEHVEFHQNRTTDIALNRVVGDPRGQITQSYINGTISAPGHVVFVNPQGIFFGKDANINVGGLLASGLDIHLEDFADGRVTFSSPNGGSGSVINEGSIKATQGDITLLGTSVSNRNTLDATGNINLMAGTEAVLTFDDGAIGIYLTEPVLQGLEAAVTNEGNILAGGEILLTASVQNDLLSYAVNTGELSRSTDVVVHEDGSFTLGAGGNVVNTGTLTAGSNISLVGEHIESTGSIVSDGQAALHGRSSVTIGSESNEPAGISGGSVVIKAGAGGCEGSAECGGESANVTIARGASIHAADTIEILAADNVELHGNIGSDTSHEAQLSVRAGNAINITGSINASANGGGPAVYLSSGDTGLQALGLSSPRIIFSSGEQPLSPASITSTGNINSHGGDIQIFAYYDSELAQRSGAGSDYASIQISGSIRTLGGDLKVGSADNRVGSFVATETLRTDSDQSGGNITIHAEHDIELHSASFGGTYAHHVADVGSLVALSNSGNIRLHGHYEYNSIKADANGSIQLTATEGSITLSRFSADDGSGQSRLHMDLRAKEQVDIDINSDLDAWLNGGNFSVTSHASDIYINGGTLYTEGGNISLTANNIALSNTALDTAGDAFGRNGGSISFHGDATLGSDLVIRTGDHLAPAPMERGALRFHGKLGSDSNPFDLSVVAGDLEFDDAIAGMGDLHINATGSVTSNGYDINASGLNVAAANFSSGNIRTGGGNVVIDVGTGSITTDDIDTRGVNGHNGGSIALNGRNVDVNSLLSDAGTGSALTAGNITIVAKAQQGSSSNVNVNGDISAASSDGQQIQASIILDGLCSNCANAVSFNSASFISGRVQVTGQGADDTISVSKASSRWTIRGNETHHIQANDDLESTGLISFQGFGHLTGSDQSDSFHVLALPSGAINIKGSSDPGSGPDYLHGPSGEGGVYEWLIDGANQGSLRQVGGGTEVIRFDGIGHLVGSSSTDRFVFSDAGAIRSIEGGTGHASIVGRNGNNTWLLSQENGFSLEATATGERYLHKFSNIDRLEGGSGADTLWAQTQHNLTWTISARDQGTISSSEGQSYVLSFAGMEHLWGGDGNDEFVFATNDSLITGRIDGGGGNNRLVGRPSDTDWHLGLYDDQTNSGRALSSSSGETFVNFASIGHVEGIAGHRNQIFGARQVNHWLINGHGSGVITVEGSGSELAFSGMYNLFGNELRDEFTLQSGYISGMIDGGAGDDSASLTITAEANGTLEFRGIEEIAVGGGSNNLVVYHAFSSEPGRGSLTYVDNGNEYRVEFSGATLISDSVVADVLNVQSRGTADHLFIQDTNHYEIDGHLTGISFDRKLNLAFLTKREDTVSIQGTINIDGALTFRNAPLIYESGRINADSLYLEGVSVTSESSRPLQTNINHIFFAGTEGDISLEEQGDLNIAQYNIGGALTISLGGSLTSSTSLFDHHRLSVDSNKDIRLIHNNSLSGGLSFRAGGDIHFKNTEDTNFLHLSGSSVDIDSRGSIYTSEGIDIRGLAVFRSEGDVLLDHGSNNFQDIRIDNARKVVIRSERNGYTVSGINSSGFVDIYSASSLDLSGTLSTRGSMRIQATGDIAQVGHLKGDSIHLQSSGNITMGSGASSSASTTINYQGADLSLGKLIANRVSLESSGAIFSSETDGLNIVADQLRMTAQSGIGGRRGLSTQVGELFLRNNTGSSHIVNGKELRITGLFSNGDIHLRNTHGNVYLVPGAGGTYWRYHGDARSAGGLADANYEIGALSIDIDNGSLFTTGRPDLNYPVLVARNMRLTATRGGLGQPLYPLVVYVKDNLVLVSALPSWVKYAFDARPINIDDSGTISGDIADLIRAGNELLVEIEPLTDIDPAVFSSVRNYAFDDISIRLPDDQLYDVDDD